MGGSRRRLKKGKSKVKVGLPVKRRPNNRLPKAQTLILPSKKVVEWDVEGTLTSNYRAGGFVLDPNATAPVPASHPGKHTPTPTFALVPALPAEEGKNAEEEQEEAEPEELQVTLGKRRKEAAEAPRYERLTRMQRAHIGRLMDKHGLDYPAMARDLKLNKLQHTPGALKFLCQRYLAYERAPEAVKAAQLGRNQSATV